MLEPNTFYWGVFSNFMNTTEKMNLNDYIKIFQTDENNRLKWCDIRVTQYEVILIKKVEGKPTEFSELVRAVKEMPNAPTY